MHVFVSVSWHTSAALMGSNSKTTNVQCTLSEGSLDLLWRAETPPHKHVYAVFASTFPSRHLAYSVHLEDACYSLRLDRSEWGALQHKRTKHAKSMGSFDWATCNRINDFNSVPGALRNLKTYCNYNTGIEYTRKHSITVHEHKVALNGLCILV
jgi:hypothetical protein